MIFFCIVSIRILLCNYIRLEMGEEGYLHLLKERRRLLPLLTSGLNRIASLYNEHILMSVTNTISIGVSLQYLDEITLQSGGQLYLCVIVVL